MPVVDTAVYVAGHRRAEPVDVDQTFEVVRDTGGMAWIGLYRPDHEEIDAVAEELGIHRLAVEDTVKAHQRPKLERYDDLLFAVLRPARYLDAEERVEFGELHVFVGPSAVVTVRHAESPDLARVRRRLESSPQLLALGPLAVLYAVVDEVVDEYAPVVAGLEDDIDEIEDQIFGGDPAVSRRIYELFREVLAFHRATHPLLGMLDRLLSDAEDGGVHEELRNHLRDVHDHVVRVVERADAFRALLQNALQVNATIVAQRQNEQVTAMTEASLVQNEQVKRISAWAAILFAPTLVGTVYGMNFEYMPELGWRWGYPFALGLMVVGSIALYAMFRGRRWL